MLEINLLPERVRKQSPSSIDQLHRTPLFWIVVLIIFGIPLGVLIPTIAFRQNQLASLQSRLQAEEPRKAEIEKLQASAQRMRAEAEEFRGMKQGQGLWSRRLNVLSDVTPEGVWFTELTLDEDRGLVIQGRAFAQGSADEGSLRRLVQDLNESAAFKEAITDIQIESVKRIFDGDIELVQFTLTGKFVGAASADALSPG